MNGWATSGFAPGILRRNLNLLARSHFSFYLPLAALPLFVNDMSFFSSFRDRGEDKVGRRDDSSKPRDSAVLKALPSSHKLLGQKLFSTMSGTRTGFDLSVLVGSMQRYYGKHATILWQRISEMPFSASSRTFGIIVRPLSASRDGLSS